MLKDLSCHLKKIILYLSLTIGLLEKDFYFLFILYLKLFCFLIYRPIYIYRHLGYLIFFFYRLFL